MPFLEAIIKEENIDVGCFQEAENSYIHGENQPRDISNNTQLKNYVFGEIFSYKVPFTKNKHFAIGNSISNIPKLLHNTKLLHAS